MWSHGFRGRVLSSIDQNWDVIIVGGGITGAGILGEATRAGLRALLLEARDFSWGTSSRSTKLVHGGLRYLRQGRVGLTRESVVERERLIREASGLVVPLGFWLTSFSGDKMPGWVFGLGLAAYDILAGKWAHSHADGDALAQKLPHIDAKKLRGGHHYFDAQTDDSRLVVRALRESVARGGVALNYAEVVDVLRTADGRVHGVAFRDKGDPEGKTYEVFAKVVISATGVFADELRGRLGKPRRLRKIRGSHLLFPHALLPIEQAVSLLHPRDGRAVFAIPWEGVTMVGTTDVDHDGADWDEPRISAAEVDYILESLDHAFPAARLDRSHVRSTFSGVRPVIDTGVADPSKESREHAIWEDSGLVTVTGGKLTTFRVMAQQALKASYRVMGGRTKLARGAIFDAEAPSLPGGISHASAVRLIGRLGREAALPTLIDASDRHFEDTVTLLAEVRFAAAREAVVHLDDLMLRRTRVGLLAANGGLAGLDAMKAELCSDLRWDEAKWAKERARYAALYREAYSLP